MATILTVSPDFVTTGNVGAADPGLLSLADFVYTGGFLLSSSTFGSSSMNATKGAFAYYAANNSIIVSGHDQNQAIAEFPVPAILDVPTMAELNISSPPTQNFRNMLNIQVNPDGIDRINGMIVIDGQLILNAEKWYAAGGGSGDTTLVLRDANNIGGEVDGYYKLTGGAHSGGYLSSIPAEWQSSFGGSEYMTGWSSVNSIFSRYSIGPSLWAFDHATLLANSQQSGAITATAYMDFPYAGTNYLDPGGLRIGTDPASAMWNYRSTAVYGFIVPGTRTFACFGGSAGILDGIGYKITQDTGNLCSGYCPYTASDVYSYYWLFDVQEILDATEVHSPRPYEYGAIDIPFDGSGAYPPIGGSYDPASGVLYLMLAARKAEPPYSRYDRMPVFVTYQVN